MCFLGEETEIFTFDADSELPKACIPDFSASATPALCSGAGLLTSWTSCPDFNIFGLPALLLFSKFGESGGLLSL